MLIEMKNIEKSYGPKEPLIVKDISFQIDRGETLGLIGDSGSGKSTIGLMLAGILAPSKGRVCFHGEELVLPFPEIPRKKIQILFQYPEMAFNPKMKLLSSMQEPYRFLRIPYTWEGLCRYLELYGIYKEHLNRYPRQLSGGELQRLALARIILSEPEFVVLDEPTSMLDTVSQAQMIHLLQRIQKDRGLGYLFISHDRVLCEKFCDRILFLSEGHLQETCG